MQRTETLAQTLTSEDAIVHVSLHVEDTKPLRGLKHLGVV